jgi:beta-N-acetylhexosaminidase
VVFTDDLCMGAIAKRYTPAESAALALRAGCDLPLVCHDVVAHLEAVAAAIEALPADILEPVMRRVERFRLHISTQKPMAFIEWNDYLKNVAEFSASIPEVSAIPGSPVQGY